VWGTRANTEDNIVWGTDCGGANCPGVVWGTRASEDNIVWGTASGEDNIVWGTSGETDNVTWATSGDDTTLFENPSTDPVTYDSSAFDDLFGATVVKPVTGLLGGLL